MVVFAERFSNWKRHFGVNYDLAFEKPTPESLGLAVTKEPTGHFGVGRRRVLRYIRPWGIGPLGTTLHDDWTVTVSVEALGYLPVSVTYYPNGLEAGPEWGSYEWKVPEFSSDGTLTVYLPAEGTTPTR